MCFFCFCFVFFFKQKTAYEMRISDWSSDVCSSDLLGREPQTNLLIIGMTSRANARGLLFWLVSKIFPGVGQQLLDLRDVAMVRLDRIRQQVHNDTCLHSGDLDRSSLKKNRILDQAVALFAQKVGPVDVHVTAPPARRQSSPANIRYRQSDCLYRRPRRLKPRRRAFPPSAP